MGCISGERESLRRRQRAVGTSEEGGRRALQRFKERTKCNLLGPSASIGSTDHGLSLAYRGVGQDFIFLRPATKCLGRVHAILDPADAEEFLRDPKIRPSDRLFPRRVGRAVRSVLRWAGESYQNQNWVVRVTGTACTVVKNKEAQRALREQMQSDDDDSLVGKLRYIRAYAKDHDVLRGPAGPTSLPSLLSTSSWRPVGRRGNAATSSTRPSWPKSCTWSSAPKSPRRRSRPSSSRACRRLVLPRSWSNRPPTPERQRTE